MKAFVMKGIGQVGFLDKPIPRPGPDDAIVRTTGETATQAEFAPDTDDDPQVPVRDNELDDVIKPLIVF